MTFNRLPAKDPRTMARDIPGIFDSLFPQLVPGVVVHLNRTAISRDDLEALPDELVKASDLRPAMLFEVAYARGEQLLEGVEDADWDACLHVASERQRRHFDAQIPERLSGDDIVVAEWVASNLFFMIDDLKARETDAQLMSSPLIPGYQWIASGHGDFYLGDSIIEVKCTNKHFSSSDYRQIVMYWLLSYAHAVENDSQEWKAGILINPRLNYIVEQPFDDIISIIGSGRSKIDILEHFSAIVGDYTSKILNFSFVP